MSHHFFILYTGCLSLIGLSTNSPLFHSLSLPVLHRSTYLNFSISTLPLALFALPLILASSDSPQRTQKQTVKGPFPIKLLWRGTSYLCLSDTQILLPHSSQISKHISFSTALGTLPSGPPPKFNALGMCARLWPSSSLPFSSRLALFSPVFSAVCSLCQCVLVCCIVFV